MGLGGDGMSGQIFATMLISLSVGAGVLLLTMIEGPICLNWEKLRRKFGGVSLTTIEKIMTFIGAEFVSGFFMFSMWDDVRRGRPKESFLDLVAILIMLYCFWYFLFGHSKWRFTSNFSSLIKAWQNWKLTLLDTVPSVLSSVFSVGLFILLTPSHR